MDTMQQQTPWLPPSEALNRPLNRQTDDAIRALSQAVTTRRLGFKIGSLGLLIAENAISELTGILSVCPIPNTASWLVGLINLRGNLLPVFDLNMLLGLEKGSEKKRMLLILGEGEAAGTIVIDGLPVHLMFSENDKLESLPNLPDAIKPFAISGYEKEGEIWFNFDHLGFFQSLINKVPA